MKFNDLDIEKWKDSDINTDSLWLMNERDKTGKHYIWRHRVLKSNCLWGEHLAKQLNW